MATYLDEQRTTRATGPSTTRRSGRPGAWARVVNVVVGAWLFFSAFLWPHSASSRTNTWIVGLLAVGFAVWAMWAPAARFLNTALSVWLFFSTLAIFHLTAATLWNNIIVAIVIFAVSLVPNERSGIGHRPRRQVPA